MEVPTGVGTLAALALAAPCFSAAMSPPIELSHGGEWEWAARGSCVSGGRFDDASGSRRGVWLAWAQRCCWSCRQLASCLAVSGMIGEPAGLGAGTVQEPSAKRGTRGVNADADADVQYGRGW